MEYHHIASSPDIELANPVVVSVSMEVPAIITLGLSDEQPKRPKTPRKKSCRQKTLKLLDSRPALIAVCILVIIECVCVLVELMVDLQGIKFRFENEENEIQRFLDYLKKEYPEDFHAFKGRTMDDILYKLKGNIRIKGEDDLYCMPCKCSCDHTVHNTSAKNYAHVQPSAKQVRHVNSSSAQTRSVVSGSDSVTKSSSSLGTTQSNTSPSSGTSNSSKSGTKEENIRNKRDTHKSDGESTTRTPSSVLELNDEPSSGLTDSSHVIENRTNSVRNGSMDIDLSKLFVLEINNVKESFFLVAEYLPDHVLQDETKHQHYHSEYEKIHVISTAIHLGSIAILSIMVIETFIKFFCVGSRFFKKKFEVFDAFIVIASFALDFIFLDSRWYETGKDATTILVLLLPWRVVRIVNSFLMTVNHKHHIEMMTIKRAKKKSEVKITKLSTLLAEIRRDVQLLVHLCRSRDIPEIDISACVYGKGRNNATIAAMSSFASLMLISTLGKNAVYEDEFYGKLLREAMADDDEDENGNDVKEDEDDEPIEIDVKGAKKVETKKKKPKRGIWKRSHTIPRRSHSYESVQNGSVFYVNDAYLNTTATVPKDDSAPREDTPARRASFQSKACVRSTPGVSRGNKSVTFEVTTQVTYL